MFIVSPVFRKYLIVKSHDFSTSMKEDFFTSVVAMILNLDLSSKTEINDFIDVTFKLSHKIVQDSFS